MEIGKTLDVSRREDWRAWLQANHAAEPEVWLVFHAKTSGKASLPYNDAVDEALCFGWIDSIVRKHGPDSRAQRFTPRRAGSPVSPMNRERIRRLREAGLMTAAGLAAAGDMPDEPFQPPADILRELEADPQVWANYQAFPESYRRIRVGWIDGSRTRPDVFRRRLDYFLRMTRQNKRFGMVQ